MWVVLLMCILLGAVLWKHLQMPTKFPPGPPCFPIVGSLFTFSRLVEKTGYFHLAVSKLGEKYGSIVGTQLGNGSPTVFLLGYEAVLQGLGNVELDGRPDDYLNNLRTMGQRRGVIATDGAYWQYHRRFLLRNLREFGFGKRSMEAIIQDEATFLVKYLEMLAGDNSEVALDEALTLPILNSLWSIVAGVRYEANNPTFKRYVDIQESYIRKLDPSGGLVNNFPFLRYICPNKSGFNHIKRHHTEMWNFFKDLVNQHKDTLQENISRDLIDVYLHEILSNDQNDKFSEPQLLSILKDLFVAGTETTSNTLSFFFLYMILYPKIQSRIQDEIIRIVGHEKLPSITHRQNMPYLSAVLQEVQRISNVGPISLPHRAMVDVEIGDYVIPKDARVLMSLYSVHMDKEYWGDPEVFRPDRHLTEEGLFIPNSRVMPFGSGQRRCLGEPLAKNSLFLFAAIVLQSISLTPSPTIQSPSSRSQKGLTLKPQSYNVLITKRR